MKDSARSEAMQRASRRGTIISLLALISVLFLLAAIARAVINGDLPLKHDDPAQSGRLRGGEPISLVTA